jgi:protein SCO1
MKGMPRWLIFTFVFTLSLLAIAGVYTVDKNSKRPDVVLETYGRESIDSTAPDGTLHAIDKIHRIRPFALTDQLGRPFTLANVQGKVYVADFFYTVDPETDSVPVLKAYADAHQANPKQWFLLTGSKKVIYDLARYDYFVTATQGDGGPDDFVHTQNFALIDQRGRIRGYYDGTKAEEVAKLATDIRILQQEGI